MFRLLACIIIIASSTTFAFIFTLSLKKRVRQLAELTRIFHFVKNEIKVFNTTIPDIFDKVELLSDDESAKIFKFTNKSLKENPGVGLEYAWRNACIENAFFLSLNQEDIEIIKNFGSMLEKSDLDGQMRNIGYIVSKLCVQEHKAIEIQKKNERLINSAGVLWGLAVSILLY